MAVVLAVAAVAAHVAAVAEFPIMSVMCDGPPMDYVILVIKNSITFNARSVVALCGNYRVMTEEYYS